MRAEFYFISNDNRKFRVLILNSIGIKRTIRKMVLEYNFGKMAQSTKVCSNKEKSQAKAE